MMQKMLMSFFMNTAMPCNFLLMTIGMAVILVPWVKALAIIGRHLIAQPQSTETLIPIKSSTGMLAVIAGPVALSTKMALVMIIAKTIMHTVLTALIAMTNCGLHPFTRPL